MFPVPSQRTRVGTDALSSRSCPLAQPAVHALLEGEDIFLSMRHQDGGEDTQYIQEHDGDSFISLPQRDAWPLSHPCRPKSEAYDSGPDRRARVAAALHFKEASCKMALHRSIAICHWHPVERVCCSWAHRPDSFASPSCWSFTAGPQGPST